MARSKATARRLPPPDTLRTRSVQQSMLTRQLMGASVSTFVQQMNTYLPPPVSTRRIVDEILDQVLDAAVTNKKNEEEEEVRFVKQTSAKKSRRNAVRRKRARKKHVAEKRDVTPPVAADGRQEMLLNPPISARIPTPRKRKVGSQVRQTKKKVQVDDDEDARKEVKMMNSEMNDHKGGLLDGLPEISLTPPRKQKIPPVIEKNQQTTKVLPEPQRKDVTVDPSERRLMRSGSANQKMAHQEPIIVINFGADQNTPANSSNQNERPQPTAELPQPQQPSTNRNTRKQINIVEVNSQPSSSLQIVAVTPGRNKNEVIGPNNDSQKRRKKVNKPVKRTRRKRQTLQKEKMVNEEELPVRRSTRKAAQKASENVQMTLRRSGGKQRSVKKDMRKKSSKHTSSSVKESGKKENDRTLETKSSRKRLFEQIEHSSDNEPTKQLQHDTGEQTTQIVSTHTNSELSSDVNSEIERTACFVCNELDHYAEMILCDACSAGCHIYCMRPTRKSIPLGSWICPHCHVTAKKHSIPLSSIIVLREESECVECHARGIKSNDNAGKICAECRLSFHMKCVIKFQNELKGQIEKDNWRCKICTDTKKNEQERIEKERIQENIPTPPSKQKRPRMRNTTKQMKLKPNPNTLMLRTRAQDDTSHPDDEATGHDDGDQVAYSSEVRTNAAEQALENKNERLQEEAIDGNFTKRLPSTSQPSRKIPTLTTSHPTQSEAGHAEALLSLATAPGQTDIVNGTVRSPHDTQLMQASTPSREPVGVKHSDGVVYPAGSVNQVQMGVHGISKERMDELSNANGRLMNGPAVDPKLGYMQNMYNTVAERTNYGGVFAQRPFGNYMQSTSLPPIENHVPTQLQSPGQRVIHPGFPRGYATEQYASAGTMGEQLHRSNPQVQRNGFQLGNPIGLVHDERTQTYRSNGMQVGLMNASPNAHLVQAEPMGATDVQLFENHPGNGNYRSVVVNGEEYNGGIRKLETGSRNQATTYYENRNGTTPDRIVMENVENTNHPLKAVCTDVGKGTQNTPALPSQPTPKLTASYTPEPPSGSKPSTFAKPPTMDNIPQIETGTPISTRQASWRLRNGFPNGKSASPKANELSNAVFVKSGCMRAWVLLNVKPEKPFHASMFVDMRQESFLNDAVRVGISADSQVCVVAFSKLRCCADDPSRLQSWWEENRKWFANVSKKVPSDAQLGKDCLA